MSAFLGGFAQGVLGELQKGWDSEREMDTFERKQKLLNKLLEDREIASETRAEGRKAKEVARTETRKDGDKVFQISYNSQGKEISRVELSPAEAAAYSEGLLTPGLENEAKRAATNTSREYGKMAAGQGRLMQEQASRMNLERVGWLERGLTPPWEQRTTSPSTAGQLTDIHFNQAASKIMQDASSLDPVRGQELVNDMRAIQMSDKPIEEKLMELYELRVMYGIGKDEDSGAPTLKIK